MERAPLQPACGAARRLRDQTRTASAAPSLTHTHSPLPPSRAPRPAPPRSDDDEEEDAEGGGGRPKKPVPDWARGPALEASIHAQYGGAGAVDPDRIFPEASRAAQR